MTIPSWISLRLAEPNIIRFFLVRIDCDPAQYLTDSPVVLVYEGQTYDPSRALEVSGIEAAAGGRFAQSVSVRIGNGDGAFGILASGWVGGAASPAVTVLDAWLDPSASSVAVQAAYPVASGRATSPSWDDQYLSFTLSPALDGEAEKVPLRTYGTNCTYPARTADARCGLGAGSCDGSPVRCAALGNTARFGGFPQIPSEDYVFTLGFQGRLQITLKRRSS